jgi:hypothetical protein
MSQTSPSTVRTPDARRVLGVGLRAAVVAAAVNTVIWFVGNIVDAMKVPAPAPAIFSVLGVLVGGVIFLALSRVTSKARTIFLIVSVVFLVAYAAAPIQAMQAPPMPGGESFNMATMIATQLMHLVAGAAAIWAYTRLR